MMVPRGKMLGGTSGINYMAYVRGHPGDFDSWADSGAAGWAYNDVLPYFKKSEGLSPSGDVVIDGDAHNTEGPLGVSVRGPVLGPPSSSSRLLLLRGSPRVITTAGIAAARMACRRCSKPPRKTGMRSSTYHAFLEPIADRPNLTIVPHAMAQRVTFEGEGESLRATGVEYSDGDGNIHSATAAKEVVLSAGAVGSPQLLMVSGVGDADELAAVGVDSVHHLPAVGKHLKDHLHTGLYFEADGVGETMAEIAVSLGPDALRAPAGPLPADPAEDENLPPELAGLKPKRSVD